MKVSLSHLALAISFLVPGLVGAGEQNCGADERATNCRPAAHRGLCIQRHHGHSHCCCRDTGSYEPQTRGTRSFAPAAAPRAMVVESMPAMLIQPQYFAMPMMAPVSTRQISIPESRSMNEPNCAGSSERLDALERKVEMLDSRMKTILDAIEVQTDLLTRIRDNGVPARAPASRTPAK
ncbi:MAG: hypothetical protein ACKPEY_12645 [Planctomycetota bacterium]